MTSAPRAAATRARAHPCLPDERLPRKRTGSSGSRVPPALITTRRPSRSRARAEAPEREHDRGERGDVGRFGQPAGAGVGAGQPADRRRQHDRAAPAERGHVLLGGGVQPHLGVHGGREHHRARGGQQRRGEQVVGAAVRGAGQQVGGGRGDDDEVGALPDPHVRDLGDVGPDVGGDRVARQRLEGGRTHEVEGAGRRDDADVVAGLGERRAAAARPCRRPLPRSRPGRSGSSRHPPRTTTHPAGLPGASRHQVSGAERAGVRLSSRRPCGSAGPR